MPDQPALPPFLLSAIDQVSRALGETDLPPVFENLERVCCAVEDEESNLYKGIMMVTKQFYKALENLGLESIETEGDFDPSVHEAVSMEPVDDESRDGCIIGTLRKGYRLAGRIIRAPQVRVGKYTG